MGRKSRKHKKYTRKQKLDRRNKNSIKRKKNNIPPVVNDLFKYNFNRFSITVDDNGDRNIEFTNNCNITGEECPYKDDLSKGCINCSINLGKCI